MWKENKEPAPSWLQSQETAQNKELAKEAGRREELTPLIAKVNSTNSKNPGLETSEEVNISLEQGAEKEDEAETQMEAGESYQHGGVKQKTNHAGGEDEGFRCTKFCSDIFTLVSTIAVLIHVSLLCGQILPCIAVRNVDKLQIALRVYISLFLVTFIGVETELLLQHTVLGNNFMIRGILYSFVGLIGVEQSASIRVDMMHTDHLASMWAQIASIILHLAAWFEIASGSCYFVMGMFCMREIRDQMRQKEQDRKEKIAAWKEAISADLCI